MEFDNEFSVPVPIDDVWAALLDVERVAPCMPGAQVVDKPAEGSYKVAIKVRVGPVSMTYKGDVEVVEQDESARRAVMRTKAKESRGQGTADATVEMRLTQQGESTLAAIHTDVAVSGKAAAMGQGVIADVSAKLIDTFAENLATMLAPAAAGEAAAASPAAEGTAPAEEAAAPVDEAAAPEDEAAAPVDDAATPEGAGAGDAVPVEASSGTGGATEAPAGDSGAAETPGEATPAPAELRGSAPSPSPAPAAAEDSSLSVLSLAGSVVSGRLRDPRVLAGTLAAVAVLSYALGRQRGR